MTQRKKAVNALAAVMLLSALCIVLAPLVAFPVCEAPMHCHESYMALTGVSAVIAAASLMIMLSKGMEACRMLCVVTAVAGAAAILYPTALIGVCASPRMPCHYGLLPVWGLSGGAVVLVSIICFAIAREESA